MASKTSQYTIDKKKNEGNTLLTKELATRLIIDHTWAFLGSDDESE